MKAIFPVLDESRREPYYMQLYRYLKMAIIRGDIGEDERLPSLRNLSRSTGLSITTVEKAYDQLLVEGYIYSRSQSGFYASHVASAGAATVPYENPIPEEKLYSVLPESSLDKAYYYRDIIIPVMNRLRKNTDNLERITDRALWPIPTYKELMFGVD